MAIYHCSIKIVSRGKGKSVVGASAYRSGEKFKNEYDGETHDYTRKGGIAFTGILLPTNAPKEYQDRCTLWNAVERVERAKNAQLARDIEVSIPKEIPREHWQRLMIEYCKTNFVSKGMIADICIHDNDPNNPHCHILLTMRPLDEKGEFGAKCKKEYVLDDKGEKIKLQSGAFKSFKVNSTDWNNKDNAEVWRGNWSDICNLYLENLGQTERIDNRSYERQGIDKIPSIHLGVACSQMEQKGIPTERGNINRQVAENNKLLKVTRARISRLMKWQREDKVKPLDLTQTGEKISIVAQLKGFTPQTQASQYQKIKTLKDYTNIISFLERNGIDDIDDFYNKIVDINKSFYVLKGEITQIDKEIYRFDKKVELWEEYEKLEPTLKKYNALSDSDKKVAYKKNFTKIDRAKELKKIWKDYMESGNDITPNVWKRESTKLKNSKKLYNWKMDQLRDELGRAEKITKKLDEMQITDERTKSKWRGAEL